MKRLLAGLLVLSCVAIGCGKDTKNSASTTTTASTGHTLEVGTDQKYKTIQSAVDASKEGDMVLVHEGVYKEEPVGVTVETPGIVIRGVDRNKVIIDGEFKRDNGIKIFSDNVAIENLTVRNNNGNGVFFTGEYNDDTTKNKILKGFRASYVTAYNNGDYGIYAFNATQGQFDHDYGSGHPDSAFYIGQCNPCNALLTDNEAENNMLGYSGTNSTGVTIVNSYFHDNRAGIVPNSEHGEKLGPNAGTTVIGNRVITNNNPDAANSKSIAIAFGNGIVLGGTSDNIVERNYVKGQILGGIVVTDQPEDFVPKDNKIRDNMLVGNKFDLAYVPLKAATTLYGNCFENNTLTTEFPAMLQETAKCGALDHDFGDISAVIANVPATPPDVDFKTVKAPPDQPNMPNAMTAKAISASDIPVKVDLTKIKTPTA